MKKDKNGIPYNLEVPIYYNVQDGSYILEMDTMIDDFNDKLKSIDSLCVKLKKEKNNEVKKEEVRRVKKRTQDSQGYLPQGRR